jgi:hypothetical protein
MTGLLFGAVALFIAFTQSEMLSLLFSFLRFLRLFAAIPLSSDSGRGWTVMEC